ncbi:efflux transporter outer membrane subunit [Acidocella aromatica]|nr:efflux transporter outer membrane subunit [Acidocella aromatica]
MRLARPCLVLACGLLSGCDLAPAYHPPQFILPSSYRGSAAFSVATPDDSLPRGDWWRRFNDPVLDQLEDEAAKNNPNIQSIAAQYQQARDIAREAEAGLFPSIGVGGSFSDNKQSFNRLFRGNKYTNNIESSNVIDATASWEPDFWDEIRNHAKAQRQLAQGSAAFLASAQLSLQAELASEYIALRGLDAEQAVYQNAIGYYTTAVNITQMRFSDNIASGLDVARSQNQLAATEVLETNVQEKRAKLQNAIADLVGVPASSFVLPPEADANLTVPQIPAELPVDMLQRRPDIADAERKMAAANSSIGVSRAAFYPNGAINAIAGFQDNGINLLTLANSLWSVGASITMPLFEGGLRHAELQRAWSAYAETRDQYRATILSAFQEVEDALSLTSLLQTEAAQEQQALSAANEAQSLSLKLYTGGLSDYLDVVVSQESALTAEVGAVDVKTRQLQAAVELIRALGGGWSTRDMPSATQAMSTGLASSSLNSNASQADGQAQEENKAPTNGASRT